MNSLQQIMQANHISVYELVKYMGKEKSSQTFWGKKIIGKQCISVIDLQLVNDFLASKGIKEKVNVVPERFFIV